MLGFFWRGIPPRLASNSFRAQVCNDVLDRRVVHISVFLLWDLYGSEGSRMGKRSSRLPFTDPVPVTGGAAMG